MRRSRTTRIVDLFRRSPAGRSRLFSFLVPLLLAAQVALGFHQLEHRLHPDIYSSSEDCAACQFATAMDQGGAPPVIHTPKLVVLELRTPPAPRVPRRVLAVANFFSRGPPASFTA